MFKLNRYPRINIRSKNELAKHISDKNLSRVSALVLINDVLNNFDRYWYDSKRSQPDKEKFVRSAVGTRLGDLLGRIDKKVLAPHDNLVPDFIFGGLSERSHIQAARSLLGTRRERVLLSLDITHFFEQIREERVFYFFHKKCGCSVTASRLLACLCCVPLGPKGSLSRDKSLARGFATSPRLAVWCNLDTFLRLSWKVKRLLRKHDPKLAVFVDDIGISASRVSPDRMEEVSKIVENILSKFDLNQELPVNLSKKKNRLFTEGVEHLGLRLGRNKLSMGGKTRSRRDKVYGALKQVKSSPERNKLLKQKRAYYRYRQQISLK